MCLYAFNHTHIYLFIHIYIYTLHAYTYVVWSTRNPTFGGFGGMAQIFSPKKLEMFRCSYGFAKWLSSSHKPKAYQSSRPSTVIPKALRNNFCVIPWCFTPGILNGLVHRSYLPTQTVLTLLRTGVKKTTCKLLPEPFGIPSAKETLRKRPVESDDVQIKHNVFR